MLRQDFPEPRYARICKESTPPLGLSGISRFRVRPAKCRCVVHDTLPLVAHEVLEGLFELKLFAARVIYYFEATLLGSRGCSEMKRSIDAKSAVCWDWKFLTKYHAEEQHYRAFFDLVDILFPSLRETEWPNSPEFNFLL